jgi:hypothetical protein
MPFYKSIKIDPADKVFSRYIRLMKKQCDNCGKKGIGKDGITGLQASHFFGRRYESIRFDPENVDVFCISCHYTLGTLYKDRYEAYKIKQLGEQGYNRLLVRKNTTGKKHDRGIMLLYYRQRLKEIENR